MRVGWKVSYGWKFWYGAYTKWKDIYDIYMKCNGATLIVKMAMSTALATKTLQQGFGTQIVSLLPAQHTILTERVFWLGN